MKVAILGLGVVGRGVYDIISKDFKDISVKYILEKDNEKIKGFEYIRATSFDQIINDEQIDVIIELIGGKRIAYEFVKKALENKKHVVTANKALMSEKYEELIELAKTNHVKLLYEASVAGAIIVLNPLKKIREINQIYKIEGILNGSTNFVLSHVFLKDLSVDDAISKAYQLGYLERGSDDDMNGLDALRKINILSMISYQTYIDEKSVLRIPLSSLTDKFINHVKAKGFVIKYIAQSEIINDKLSIRIEPIVFSSDSDYSKINYEENIVSIFGKYHLKQSFIGQGAGRYPTASAVIYDLLSIKDKSVHDLTFDKSYEIDNDTQRYYFLIQTDNKIIKSKLMTFNEVMNDKDIICFSRIEEALYEKL